MNRTLRSGPSARSAFRPDPDEWLAMANDPEFRALVASKRKFLLSSWLLVVSSFFSLSIGVALAPEWFARRVFGEINIGLILAFGEVLLVLVVAGLYVFRASRDFDPRADQLAARFSSARRD